MPSFNLPKPNTYGLPSIDSKLKSLEDTTIRLVKEINYLLMHLDQENVPVLGEFMQSTDGRFSEITQSVDDITLRVGNAEGNISQLNLDVDGINASVSNIQGDVSQLNISIDGINASVSNLEGDVGQLNINVDNINASVSNLEGDFASMEIDVDNISLTVADKVGYNEVISSINLSPEAIVLDANRIDMNGIVRVNQYLNIGSASLNDEGVIRFNDSATIYSSDVGRGNYDALTMSASDVLFDGNVGLSFLSPRGSRGYIQGTWDFGNATIDDFDYYYGGTGITVSSSGRISLDQGEVITNRTPSQDVSINAYDLGGTKVVEFFVDNSFFGDIYLN